MDAPPSKAEAENLQLFILRMIYGHAIISSLIAMDKWRWFFICRMKLDRHESIAIVPPMEHWLWLILCNMVMSHIRDGPLVRLQRKTIITTLRIFIRLVVFL